MAVLILASASARRRTYLEELRVELEVRPANVDESRVGDETPEAMVQRLARAKARAAAAPGRWVLAADTIVAQEGNVLGKPVDRHDARRMLRLLSARPHRVLTGVVLLAPDGEALVDEVALTRVRFRALGEDEIEAYLATGEADDKAGAYGIQGRAGAFVEAVDGSFSNVVGLPLEVVAPALRRAGLLAER